MARTIPASKLFKSQLKEGLRTNPAFKYVDRALNRRHANDSVMRTQAQSVDILRRVAILVLLERQLHRFADAGARAEAPVDTSVRAATL